MGIKKRALRLDSGNFSWGSESIAKKTRIIDTVYNPCNNELVRTKTLVKNKERQKTAAVEHALEDQFMTGRVLAAVSSRPGQSGRADGYILEGKELEFYLRKIKAKKGNK